MKETLGLDDAFYQFKDPETASVDPLSFIFNRISL